ncbi:MULTISPECIES: hypothetical protein [unclassified Caballeronia]|uniref:hypothetical protein n=1 Tax=unclassified Caballeronia TaxID=2646786 RepID=UPI002027B520|nr:MULTISPECIES: hypothetical protein [unclassified Caballeronia]
MIRRERLRARIASQEPNEDEQCLCFVPNQRTAFFPIACRVHVNQRKEFRITVNENGAANTVFILLIYSKDMRAEVSLRWRENPDHPVDK